MSEDEIRCPFCGIAKRSTYSLSTWETHKNRCYLIHTGGSPGENAREALASQSIDDLKQNAIKRRILEATCQFDVMLDCRFYVPSASPIVHLSPAELNRVYPDGLQSIQEKIKGKSLCSSLQDSSSSCPTCGGNDAHLPCAFPGEKQFGCLRDIRLRAEESHKVHCNYQKGPVGGPGCICLREPENTYGQQSNEAYLELVNRVGQTLNGRQGPESLRTTQHGGSHYKGMQIEPVTIIHENNLDFFQGTVLRYIMRHKLKGGAVDVKKAIHFCQMICEFQYGIITEVTYKEPQNERSELSGGGGT